MAGWVNVDSLAKVNPDMVVDLDSVWPWGDETVDAIYCHHVFEHLPDIIRTLRECYRVLKVGGTLEVVVPYAMNTLAFQDPTHKSFWTDVTSLYFVKGHPYNCKYTEFGFDLDFCYLRNQKEDASKMSISRFLRDLIPKSIRSKLTYVLFGMYDEVHFRLIKL